MRPQRVKRTVLFVSGRVNSVRTPDTSPRLRIGLIVNLTDSQELDTACFSRRRRVQMESADSFFLAQRGVYVKAFKGDERSNKGETIFKIRARFYDQAVSET